MAIPLFTVGASQKRSRGGLGILNKIISANTQNYNLYNDAVLEGWDTVSPLTATITIASSTYLWSDNSSAALIVGTFPSGSTINIINNGFIMGRGGNGGDVSNSLSPPTAGSNAIDINYNVTIDTTNGYIGGGGGGGGGGVGRAGGGGGAGGGSSSNISAGIIISGGAIGSNGTNGTSSIGASGGRRIPGSNTIAVFAAVSAPLQTPVGRIIPGTGGEAGGPGGLYILAAPGGGATSGRAGDGSGFGFTGNSAVVTTSGGGGEAGGGGGGYGASGGSGGITGSGPTAGAAGGKAVNLNGKTVTWVGGFDSTRVFGSVS